MEWPKIWGAWAGHITTRIQSECLYLLLKFLHSGLNLPFLPQLSWQICFFHTLMMACPGPHPTPQSLCSYCYLCQFPQLPHTWHGYYVPWPTPEHCQSHILCSRGRKIRPHQSNFSGGKQSSGEQAWKPSRNWNKHRWTLLKAWWGQKRALEPPKNRLHWPYTVISGHWRTTWPDKVLTRHDLRNIPFSPGLSPFLASGRHCGLPQG